MRRVKCVSILFLFPLLLSAQDKIETDRPTEGLTAKTVGRGVFQIESGVRKDGQNNTDYSVRHPDVEWRYGLLNFLELQAGTVVETQRFPGEGRTGYGLLPVELGTKVTVLESKDTAITVSLFGRLGLPKWASEDHRLDKAFYRARLLMDGRISKRVTVQVNAGRDWQGTDQKQVWVYAVSPRLDLGEKWQVFAESYGFLKNEEAPAHYASGGLAYFIGNNVELDVNAGKGLGGSAAEYFITAGLSFRLK